MVCFAPVPGRVGGGGGKTGAIFSEAAVVVNIGGGRQEGKTGASLSEAAVVVSIGGGRQEKNYVPAPAPVRRKPSKSSHSCPRR